MRIIQLIAPPCEAGHGLKSSSRRIPVPFFALVEDTLADGSIHQRIVGVILNKKDLPQLVNEEDPDFNGYSLDSAWGYV